ncbi:hypothetical protein N0V86_000043 [Didymella sp. IMI 355093]|nr:hypothetical protein N0V86_000043 [Didymella sp. IMI 355093]
MPATRNRQDSTMGDLEDKLAATLARGFDSNGQPREGFYNLTRRMENAESEQFDVDHTIQDFLVYKATNAVFEWHTRADKWDSDLPNALITMTADSHGLEKNFQTANQILDDSTITSARQRRASELALPPTFPLDQFSDPDRPALDQLLPLFIELTTARTLLGDEWEPSSDWFELAGQFMLQAVIDQYITNGHCSIERFTAIFALGDPGARRSSEGTDVTAMRSLFCTGDTSGTELSEWNRIRSSNIETANVVYSMLQGGDDWYPYVKFENSLLSFLQHLHESAAKPDIVQVEEGRINIDGNELTEIDSKEVIKRIRLDV